MTRLAALLLVVSAAACATDDAKPIDETKPRQYMPEAQNPTFTLFVSNQSLDMTKLDIHVSIDGQAAVGGDFDVFAHPTGEDCGGPLLPQHNWYEFNFELTPGAHEVEVASDDVGATLHQTVTIGPRQYGILDYWFDAAQTPERFDFTASAQEPGFD